MGCCCSRSARNQADSEGKSVEMSKNAMHVENSCKCGKFGKGIRLTKSDNFHVEGSGTVIGSCILDCDTAYFEVKLGKNATATLAGVKRFDAKNPSSLDSQLDKDANSQESPSWYFKYDLLKEGDVVGVYWDQTALPMLSFTLNGVEIPSASINRIRPANEIYPAISLDDSSAEIIFDGRNFQYPPKSKKFQMIVCATSLI
jgi:hypothetical protein